MYGKLGEGQFGAVYELAIGGHVYALKKLKEVSHLDGKRLEGELRTLTMCADHPNIVKVITARIDVEINIQMEYCNLGTLNDYVIKNRPGEGTLNYFMLDMARGIHHLHRQRIIHRDIKPSNVLLVARAHHIPTCKIADAGLARLTFPFSNLATISYTYYMTTGLCTPLYVAPDVFTGHYSTASDVFSLGVLFYAMHSLQTFHVKNKTLLYPVLPQSNGMFHCASQEEIKRAVMMHVFNAQKADMVSSMLELQLWSRPGADSVESTINSLLRFTRKHDSCNLV
ncbi:serine/threonine-protein kinase Nek7-like [Haliotis rubra]|uniref:serine/threonine-protein kinase Nek7-like n=1 Tax=Haliotis rubra TaxID=36100 RepID=UPI001EE5FBCD|nr:serine/threonine-protein kinase Nek7-like [Haliotis rubra]